MEGGHPRKTGATTTDTRASNAACLRRAGATHGIGAAAAAVDATNAAPPRRTGGAAAVARHSPEKGIRFAARGMMGPATAAEAAAVAASAAVAGTAGKEGTATARATGEEGTAAAVLSTAEVIMNAVDTAGPTMARRS